MADKSRRNGGTEERHEWHNVAMTDRYEVLSHTADTGVIVSGATLAEVFENAAFAMFDLMFGLGDPVTGEQVRIEVEAATVEDLLVDWLSSLLFEAETRDLAFVSFEVEAFEECRLLGRVGGVASAGLALFGPPIKAVTYHQLSIEESEQGWSARVLFDV